MPKQPKKKGGGLERDEMHARQFRDQNQVHRVTPKVKTDAQRYAERRQDVDIAMEAKDNIIRERRAAEAAQAAQAAEAAQAAPQLKWCDYSDESGDYSEWVDISTPC